MFETSTNISVFLRFLIKKDDKKNIPVINFIL
ncbi:hypothetical protein B0I22_0869 [Epilithonimonas xixisoli]|uniref:Uncharacterized protein n=1 Tax=Epilithonimonas xixisoli TaxID=1476462 RepID=A0A4R8IAY3_9FLAO|nr:hypothetical protein B0I22_0869 [Epilithonimonas xixisoli]